MRPLLSAARPRAVAGPAPGGTGARRRTLAVVALFASVGLGMIATVAVAMYIDTHVRAYIQGEGLWSKAQKDAVIELVDFATTGHETSWRSFLDEMSVMAGDKQARLELDKPQPDMAVVTDGFLAGRIDAERVPGMAWLYRTFGGTPYLRSAIAFWQRGDAMIGELDEVAGRIRQAVLVGDTATVERLLVKVHALNGRLTRLEAGFSRAMSAAAVWAGDLALMSVVAVVVVLMALCALVVVILLRRVGVADRRFRQLFAQAPDAIVVTGADGQIVGANPAAGILAGIPEPTLVGRHIDDLLTLAGPLVGGERRGWVTRADGVRVPVDTTSSALDGADRGLRTSILRDVTERAAATAALERSEQRLRMLLAQLPAVVWTTGPDLRIATIAGRALEPLGLTASAVVGQPIEQFFTDDHDGSKRGATQAALTGRAGHFVNVYAARQFDVHVEPLRMEQDIVGILGIALDVTDRRALEDRLGHTQRLESLGRLATSVAHDFNNVLTAITGYADLLVRELPDEVHRTDAEEIRTAAQRGTRLTRQLLAFGRRQTMSPEVVDLGAVVARMDGMLRRLLGEDVELTVVHERTYHSVYADPTQLEQVLLNLAVNARDAMPEGGRLVMRVGPGDPIGGRPSTRLLVVDDGHGMDEATRARIFEPFFTTKPAGVGTGLGLATVFGIVEQSGGRIDVASAPGVGTTFAIELPVASGTGSVAPAAPEDPHAGNESILVVDDEPAILGLAARVLARSGYRVETAPDAVTALAHLERGHFDLLVTDVMMPGTNGRDLAASAVRTAPDLRILFMSGFSGDTLGEDGAIDPGVQLLPKPFTPNELLHSARTLLDRAVA